MTLDCPRCGTANREVARFCSHCGLALVASHTGLLGAGRVPHPAPLSPPGGCEAVSGAAGLFFCWQPVGGGKPLLGTEPLIVNVFNGGYALANVVLRIRGSDRRGRNLIELDREIETCPRGRSSSLEIPSYELPGPVDRLVVEFVQAEFSADQGC